MKLFKRLSIVFVLAFLFVATPTLATYAENTEQTIVETPVNGENGSESVGIEIPEEESDDIETGEIPEENTIDEIVKTFTEYLKEKYGTDYEYYYNEIMTQWGSIEAYLLQFSKDYLPEEAQSSFDEFVAWLTKYSTVWVPIVAVVLVVLVAVFGKKTLNKIVESVTKTKVSPLVSELNKQSKALAALEEAVEALLPKSEKYVEQVVHLEESKKELMSDEIKNG